MEFAGVINKGIKYERFLGGNIVIEYRQFTPKELQWIDSLIF